MRPTRIILLALALLETTAAQDAGSDFAADLRPLLARHCFDCHDSDGAESGLDLTSPSTATDVQAAADTWRRVLHQVRSGFMPPSDGPDLPVAERAALVLGLEALLPQADEAAERSVTIRRLSRSEYANTIRDLFGVAIDPDTLPADSPAYGFDRIGDAMFVTPVLLESYFDVTKAVLDAAFATGTEATPSTTEESAPARARARLAPLMRRAFRRPPTADEIETRVALTLDLAEAGATFTAALRSVYESVLLSPHFLFRVEIAPAHDGPAPLDDHELAVRLSYFLWSTMPDAALDELADGGRLHEPETLAAEVVRMLRDPRSRALADDFAAQWLGFGEIRTKAVDYRRFLWLGDDLRHAMYEESARVFDAIVRDDRPIAELLDADWTFLNERLAKHYGVDGVSGGAMRRVALADRRRGGVLTQASVLTVTSQPLRTSPVVRGRWILETLLGTPPPPPPPDAGVLPPDDDQKDGLTLRQRLERHRAEPRCASCHARIDPFGFALETYDGVGRWRTEVHGVPVDARGTLPDGTEVDGPIALKDALLARRDDFARSLFERLLVYAIGRPVGAGDRPLVERAVARARAAGYRLSGLIQSLVASDAFRLHEGQRDEPDQEAPNRSPR